jgi:hypothetical protein
VSARNEPSQLALMSTAEKIDGMRKFRKDLALDD